MAANIPAKIKAAGVTPFVLRATQLEKVKPVIAYWCNYWVVNQILAKQLHSADEECLEYTTALMDRLEMTKEENAGNKQILDDTEGQAAVKLFANDTFERAMRTMKANKVTQQTAVTFEAAATFLTLLNIWNAADAEITKKIKFSKWNATRILRALKEGNDPNESNPKLEEETSEIDNNDPELQAIMNGQPQPATVEDAPEEDKHGLLDVNSHAANSSHYSPAPVSAPTSPPHGSAPAPEQVSPIAPPDQPTPDGYFPSAPAPIDEDPPIELPSAPSTIGDPLPGATNSPGATPGAGPQDSSAPLNLPDTPQDFYRSTAPTPHLPPPQNPSFAPQQPQPLPPPMSPPTTDTKSFYAPPSASGPQPIRQATETFSGGPPTNAVYNSDDMSIVQAQKHAKWAISALNFEDVPTAVRELKSALRVLGAGT